MRDPQSGEDATGLAGRRRWRPAADRADEDGDDERPEVDLLATAERMSVIRHLSALSDAMQEQQSVACIDQGMHAL